jgi:acyl carrier protein
MRKSQWEHNRNIGASQDGGHDVTAIAGRIKTVSSCRRGQPAARGRLVVRSKAARMKGRRSMTGRRLSAGALIALAGCDQGNVGNAEVRPPDLITPVTGETINNQVETADANGAANATDPSADLEARVVTIVVEHLGVDRKRVTMDARFKEDLGADSLDAVELVMACEEAFGVEIPDEAAERFETVGDAVNYIRANMA